ncbi:MAG TPA: AAA family ATPase [Methanoculleus sp.]|nr:AAA family ATPase [Methanoculleus sp.]
MVQILAETAGPAGLNRSLLYWSVTRGLLDLTENLQEIASGEMKVLEGRGVLVQKTPEGLYEIVRTEPGPGPADPYQILEDIERYPESGIFVLADYHHYLRTENPDPITVRKVRDLFSNLKDTKKTVILICPRLSLPGDLEKEVTYLDLPLPSRDELGAMLDQAVAEIREIAEEGDERTREALAVIEPQLADRDKIVEAGAGLTRAEWENVIAKCFVSRRLETSLINQEKRQIIKKGGLLEFFETPESMASVGGLANLKAWLMKAKLRFTPKAKAFGLTPPRGILLVGPPGTGKSLVAKVASHELQIPALRLDMSMIASKYYGETSNNIRKALDMADAVAPVEFWLDEVEKMFASGQGGSGGHEETMRSLGAVLTHFEESTQPVFRIATCNQIQNLPPEFMARFEKVFFVDLPSAAERQEIFAIHLRQVGRDPAGFDLAALAAATERFVGREIRNLVQEALQTAFYEGVEVTTDHLLAEAGKVTPIFSQKEDEINALRKWAERNAEPASAVVAAEPAKANKGKGRRGVEF